MTRADRRYYRRESKVWAESPVRVLPKEVRDWPNAFLMTRILNLPAVAETRRLVMNDLPFNAWFPE